MKKFFCQYTFYDDSTFSFFVDCDSIVNAYLKAVNVFNNHAFNMVDVTYFNIEKM